MDMSEDKALLCPSARGELCSSTRFHKYKRIKKLLNRYGHRILWLPPYNPDLNPIEKKWAEVKTLRQGWGENNLNHLFSNVCCYNFKLD
ncbi:transposase [Psychrobacter celer]|uniref:transposase n=1 Tax=Psychrobacter celer TaxID=306572 RepID=UPI001865DAA9